jgi:hypothetical protein
MSGHGPRTSLLSGVFCINNVITMDTCQGTTKVLPLGPADLMDGFHEGLDIGLDRRAPVDSELSERHRILRYGGRIHDLVVESGPFAADMSFSGG